MAEQSVVQKKKRTPLKGLSVSQIVAGVIAAALSLLAAPQIGFYGVAICAAIGIVTSIIVSQIYRRFLQSSLDEMQEMMPEAADESATDGIPAADAENPVTDAPAAESVSSSSDEESSLSDDEFEFIEFVDKRRRRLRQNVIIMAIAASIAAAFLSALIITISTGGDGIGQKPETVSESLSQSQSSTDDESLEQRFAGIVLADETNLDILL